MLVVDQQWRPQPPDVRSAQGQRSVDGYLAVLRQFGVEQSQRYRPGAPGITWCNIFVWDVTSAMGCEIPHWYDPTTGATCAVGEKTITGLPAREMTANGTVAWLATHAPHNGWHQVPLGLAQYAANAGHPVVCAWVNPAGAHGHVAMLMPSGDAVTRVIMAGRSCGVFLMKRGFGGKIPTLWSHD